MRPHVTSMMHVIFNFMKPLEEKYRWISLLFIARFKKLKWQNKSGATTPHSNKHLQSDNSLVHLYSYSTHAKVVKLSALFQLMLTHGPADTDTFGVGRGHLNQDTTWNSCSMNHTKSFFSVKLCYIQLPITNGKCLLLSETQLWRNGAIVYIRTYEC